MDTLYHYTSLDGLIGILHSKRLWATNVSYLNDTSEFYHGLNYARHLGGGIFMDDYLEAFGRAICDGITSVSADELYVASFSEKPDLLSQWRGYCPPGAGVCLGFDYEKLNSFCDRFGYRLEKCVYDHESQNKDVEDLVNKCLERFPKPKFSRADFEKLEVKDKVDAVIEYSLRVEGPEKPQAAAAVGWLCEQLAELALIFKNKGFHEEAEWRVVASKPKDSVKFRTCSSFLAPYIELPVLSGNDASALREVYIGPNPNQRRCVSSVVALLLSCGFDQSDVRLSLTPFNSW